MEGEHRASQNHLSGAEAHFTSFESILLGGRWLVEALSHFIMSDVTDADRIEASI